MTGRIISINIFVFSTVLTSILLVACADKKQEKEWISLLDKDLSKWNMYLSYEIKNGYDGSIPKDINGDTVFPIGLNKNYKNVFTVLFEDNVPILKISGEVYGCVFSKDSYKNYHLKLKMKWGTKKWEPRLDEALDSGLLYHSQGECGSDYWRSWMTGHEFQLIEKGCGDYWCIGKTRIDVKARHDSGQFIFDPEAAQISIGAGTSNGHYCAINSPNEKPNGEWNLIELICYEDKSIHIVNDSIVMTLSNLSVMNRDNNIEPLIEGKLQLQSEAAEVYYKDIMIKPIDRLPERFQQYFN